MSRFYVKNNDDYWNIFSTIIDDYIYDEFVPFCEMKSRILRETLVNKDNELDSLRTDKPELNVMTLEEVEEYIKGFTENGGNDG